MKAKFGVTILLTGVLWGCGRDDPSPATEERSAEGSRERAGVYAYEGDPTPEELERGRLDASWRDVVQLDSVEGMDSLPNPERWEQITAEQVNGGTMYLPLYGDVSGPSVLRVQTLLDRALFSPGMIDGRWGANTEKAVYWLQTREGLRATGRVDQPTFDRLVELAGRPEQLAVPYRLTMEDVQGPFVDIPDDIYEQAELDCLCYESLTEKLSELFHVTPGLLARMNPGVDLNAATAGTTVRVPAIRSANAGGTPAVARLVVSDRGSYVHALDAGGRILYHFPSTLGSTYNPSPEGDYQVTAVALDPDWHYQPEILEDAEPGPDAIIPPGPNSAVGKVWMELNKPHYGVHGTRAPQTIGYATSSGCVRLTNWDAVFLSGKIDKGTPVEFRDT